MKHRTCGSCRFRVAFKDGAKLCTYGFGYVSRAMPACSYYLPLNNFRIRVVS